MSRELDVQVARVMGLNIVAEDWPCSPDGESGELGPDYAARREDGRWVCTYYEFLDVERHPVYGDRVPEMEDDGTYLLYGASLVPFYSTDWAEAGPLLDWLHEHYWHVTLDAYRDVHRCTVQMTRESDEIAEFGDTPLEAICKAVVAVKAAQP